MCRFKGFASKRIPDMTCLYEDLVLFVFWVFMAGTLGALGGMHEAKAGTQDLPVSAATDHGECELHPAGAAGGGEMGLSDSYGMCLSSGGAAPSHGASSGAVHSSVLADVRTCGESQNGLQNAKRWSLALQQRGGAPTKMQTQRARWRHTWPFWASCGVARWRRLSRDSASSELGGAWRPCQAASMEVHRLIEASLF